MPRAVSLSPGKALARERVAWLRQQARAKLTELREAIRLAKRRRELALERARGSCRKGRAKAREQIGKYRAAELARIKAEVQQMRNAARAQCQARKHRVRSAAARALDRRQGELRAEQLLQFQLQRAERIAARKRNTARERREESDDAVRSNLPRELVPVFERVRRHIHGTRHRSRTEAFLEWAEEHPEDVIAYQGDATDAEVRRLVAEYEATERQLKKTKPPRARRVAGVPF